MSLPRRGVRLQPLVSRVETVMNRYVYFALLLLASACDGAQAHPDPGDSGAQQAGSHAGEPSLVNNTCTGSDCVCMSDAGLQALCHGQCLSYASDRANCGACDHACGADMSCVAGQCNCGNGLAACGANCVDMRADRANCGGCGKTCADGQDCQAGMCTTQASSACSAACSGGRICLEGACACPSGLLFCGDSCVDPQLNTANCGACGNVCPATQTCQSGTCQCAAGQQLCGASCVDLQNDPANCGGCAQACSSTQACTAGACRVLWSDGCSATSAHEVTLREISVYQSIKVPVMQGGNAIATTARAADIVAGRFALFRVFVDLGSHFSAHDVSARLTIANGNNVDRYALKQKLNAASTDADATSTFQLTVPADKITTGTRYSVELVDCAAASGDVLRTRFPASAGESELGARKTGILKVTIIPVKANGRVPDLSDASLAVYRAFLEAMYPIERAELSVGKQISTTYPINWTTLVDQIRLQRKTDNPANDMYYYGMLQPTATLKDYCKGGCTAGIGYVTPATQAPTRAAVGLAYADEISSSTMAHEIGHNNGRNHAPCAPSNAITGVDDAYPYSGAKLGTWGYDVRKQTFVAPTTTQDIMGYCDPKWVSDYTYGGLIERVALVNSPEGLMPSDTPPIAQYRVLLVDADGPRWSVPLSDPTEAFGTEEMADILDIYGQPIAQVTVYRTAVADGSGSTILVPEPTDSSWNAVHVMGADPIAFSAPVTVPAPVP